MIANNKFNYKVVNLFNILNREFMIKNKKLFLLLLLSYSINKAIDSNIDNKNKNEFFLIEDIKDKFYISHGSLAEDPAPTGTILTTIGLFDSLSAEDINEIAELKECINYDSYDEFYNLKYQDLFVLAIAALKKMNKKIQILEEEQLKQAQELMLLRLKKNN